MYSVSFSTDVDGNDNGVEDDIDIPEKEGDIAAEGDTGDETILSVPVTESGVIGSSKPMQ